MKTEITVTENDVKESRLKAGKYLDEKMSLIMEDLEASLGVDKVDFHWDRQVAEHIIAKQIAMAHAVGFMDGIHQGRMNTAPSKLIL